MKTPIDSLRALSLSKRLARKAAETAGAILAYAILAALVALALASALSALTWFKPCAP